MSYTANKSYLKSRILLFMKDALECESTILFKDRELQDALILYWHLFLENHLIGRNRSKYLNRNYHQLIEPRKSLQQLL